MVLRSLARSGMVDRRGPGDDGASLRSEETFIAAREGWLSRSPSWCFVQVCEEESFGVVAVVVVVVSGKEAALPALENGKELVVVGEGTLGVVAGVDAGIRGGTFGPCGLADLNVGGWAILNYETRKKKMKMKMKKRS